MSVLRLGSGLSTDIDALRGVAEATTDALASFDDDDMPNLVVAFISEAHRDSADDVAAFLGERFPGAATIGCASDGIVADSHELEAGPAVSICAAFLPDTVVCPFGLRFEEKGDGEYEYFGWPDMLMPDAGLVMMCDRFSFPVDHFLSQINETRPGTVVVGGVASAGRAPGETRLFYGGKVFTDGAVAVAISGRVRLHTLVSQACRPVGKAGTVTRADRQMIFQIAGERPIDLIRDMWKNAEPTERALIQAGLTIGRVVDEYKTEFERGDFVIREVVGSDAETGAIAVGDMVEVGQTVQFQVRDPDSASEDLRRQIDLIDVRPAGALLFTCTGRGSNLFNTPDHDAATLSKGLGVPIAGSFCAGELAPVAGHNCLHSYTASVGLLVDSLG